MDLITRQAIKVDTASPDENGYLLFHDERLVVVVVKLEAETNDDDQGRWNVEAAFDGLAVPSRTFASIDDVETWLRDHFAEERRG